jgi:hypothetical protein
MVVPSWLGSLKLMPGGRRSPLVAKEGELVAATADFNVNLSIVGERKIVIGT